MPRPPGGCWEQLTDSESVSQKWPGYRSWSCAARIGILIPIEQIENGGQISRLFLVPVCRSGLPSPLPQHNTRPPAIPRPPGSLPRTQSPGMPLHSSQVAVQTCALQTLFRGCSALGPSCFVCSPAGSELWRSGAPLGSYVHTSQCQTHWLNDDRGHDARRHQASCPEPQTWWFSYKPWRE